MKQKSKTRKRKFTTATKRKIEVMNSECFTHSHLHGQGFEGHTLKGLGKKHSGTGTF
jgi:hypothetical protein